MQHPVATSQNGKIVVVDLVASAAAADIARQPHIVEMAAALLKANNLHGSHTWLSKDMGYKVGNCNVIELQESDHVFYAQRLKSDLFTPFVKNKQLKPTNIVSIELSSSDGHIYAIQQIILGPPVPPLPEEGTSTTASTAFWSKHALLANDWPIKTSTVTSNCPWPNHPA